MKLTLLEARNSAKVGKGAYKRGANTKESLCGGDGEVMRI